MIMQPQSAQRETARRLDEVDLRESANSPQEVRKLVLLINADQPQPKRT